MKKLPLGEQDYSKIVDKNQLYVDKTERIYDLINYSDYAFLSRPRRFGKSLLVSTLAAIFEGRKEWFKGLWIEDKIDWQSYPVIRLDFAGILHSRGLEEMDISIRKELEFFANKYDVDISTAAAPIFFQELIPALFEKTGKRVVLLIDEYDSPINNHLIEFEKAEANREALRDLYEVIKAKSRYIHFFFITGISKFAKMSIFSVLNQITDLSLRPEFNDLIGFTEEEVREYFAEHLQKFSQKTGWSIDTLMDKIRYWYDGYTWNNEQHIYNPWAIVNVFANLEFDHYWFESGTPSFLLKLIKHKYALEVDKPPVIEDFEAVYATKYTFDSHNLKNIDLKALLFQTGYLTIKDIKRVGGDTLYTLGYPNYEVRWSMTGHLLQTFTEMQLGNTIMPKAILLKEALRQKELDNFFIILRSLFAGIPTRILKQTTEYNYQALFYMVLTLLGIDNVILEKEGYMGRADGILELEQIVYVFEFKFARKGTMKALLDSAMKQIFDKGYHHAYLGKGKLVWKVAVGFLYKKKGKEENPVLTMDKRWTDKERL